jgi:hypothetical protein
MAESERDLKFVLSQSLHFVEESLGKLWNRRLGSLVRVIQLETNSSRN